MSQTRRTRPRRDVTRSIEPNQGREARGVSLTVSVEFRGSDQEGDGSGIESGRRVIGLRKSSVSEEEAEAEPRKYVTRQVHVNLLKEYVGDVEALGVTAAAAEETPMSDFTPKVDARLDNASQWECLEQELSHLEES
ncbi:hypothetical protein Pcinc_012440 [Petrolisthes cinctipes]|uniref:Uncharacterized protein n=1 Tax=Petrolisthes cinctipes TaxID=88211 RepID=A0AAE1KVE0_PETCI|nr:hypothetical protein Pcinc_012440 [Petrolisthes cinctipes]